MVRLGTVRPKSWQLCSNFDILISRWEKLSDVECYSVSVILANKNQSIIIIGGEYVEVDFTDLYLVRVEIMGSKER